MILRPCDQYPSEPGVLKTSSRPISAQSNGGVFMGNLNPKTYEESEHSELEEESKVGLILIIGYFVVCSNNLV